MSAFLFLLLDATLRATALGILVALLLKMARLGDTRSEITIWTIVLLAALMMPLLNMEVPNWLTLPLPRLTLGHAALAQGLKNGPMVTLTNQGHGLALVPGRSGSYPGLLPLIQHGAGLLWPIYFLAVAIQAVRLAIGLILTLRLYRSATPIVASWATGRVIRASTEVRGPITFGRCIVLPAGYKDWPCKKLLAVLAHEESHVRRGDFFIQLLANVYRVVFWFNPFAWWLQGKLCALAEAASDEAAIECLEDRTAYAEILVEVSRCAHGTSVQIAMAKGPDIHWRIDRILNEKQDRRLSLPARIATALAIIPVALIVAGANAAVPSVPARLPRLLSVPPQPPVFAQAHSATPAPLPQAPKYVPARRAKPVAAVNEEPDVTYNPRALLDEPSVAVAPAILSISGGESSKNGGNAAILLGGLSDN